jgi:hypothetical protein
MNLIFLALGIEGEIRVCSLAQSNVMTFSALADSLVLCADNGNEARKITQVKVSRIMQIFSHRKLIPQTAIWLSERSLSRCERTQSAPKALLKKQVLLVSCDLAAQTVSDY